MATEFTAPSGARVTINYAGFKAAKDLKKVIEREVAKSGRLSFSAILLVDSSDEVDSALWPCLARCLYNKEKITEQTFDKPEALQDYYDIVIACVKENLGPLAESLRSKLSEFGLLKMQADTDTDLKSE